MSNPSARHELVCAIVQRHPKSVIALAEAVGVQLPEHDDVMSAPDAHPMRDGRTVYTDGTVRLLRDGRPVFFASVEMQRKFGKDKYVTLHAYHGSGVRNVDAGGHLFVLSDKAAATARFRAEDTTRRAELAFAASFHSGRDLKLMEDQGLPLGARALPAALADFRADMPRTREMLDELTVGDSTLANLYLRAIVEEVPYAMLGEILRPDMRDKLRTLEWFREYEAEVEAKANAKAKAEADAAAAVAAAAAAVAADVRVAAAEAEVTQARAQVSEARVETKAETLAETLTDFLVLRGDQPSEHALNTIGACHSAAMLAAWLKRAYLGETTAQLFPEPKPPAS